MSSRVFVRRGRNNLRDERKGSWQRPVCDTSGIESDAYDKVRKSAVLSDDKARPFKFSPDPIHKSISPDIRKEAVKDRDKEYKITDKPLDISSRKEENKVRDRADEIKLRDNSDASIKAEVTLETKEDGSKEVSKKEVVQKEVVQKEVSKKEASHKDASIKEAAINEAFMEESKRNGNKETAKQEISEQEELKGDNNDPGIDTNSIDDINLDELKVENAAGEWVEYHSLRERIASFDFRDRSFLIKAFIAVFLVITIIFFSLQCIILKSEYDRINDKLVAIQNEFNEYRDSLEALEDDNKDVPLSDNSEAVTTVSKQTPSEDGIRYVYLTFDDGPSPCTDEILDILASYDVKATFFVCGKPGYDEMYKRIVDEGHTIGMHSYSHDYKVIYESLDSFQTDLHKIQNYIFDVTGVWTTYYRFPGGSSNTASQVPMSDLIGYLDRNNITYFDWNVYGGDNIASDIIVSNVTANITEHENCMILLHDAGDKKETVEALPEIIEYIQSLPNTMIVPVTEDTIPVQHSKN